MHDWKILPENTKCRKLILMQQSNLLRNCGLTVYTDRPTLTFAEKSFSGSLLVQ